MNPDVTPPPARAADEPRDEHPSDRLPPAVVSAKLAALGELAGAVAHEINNPLQVVTGAAELLARAAAPHDPEAEELLQHIYDGVGRCTAVVRALLTFAAPPGTTTTRSHLSEAADVMRTLVRTALKRQGLDLRVDVEPEAVVDADVGALAQAVTYLVFNAAEASPRGAEIRVRGWREPQHVCLSVADDGAGVDPAIRDRLFEPFFTTHGLDTSRGLGLSMVWGIARGHGGTVDVDSEVGVGSTFTVRLPRPR